MTDIERVINAGKKLLTSTVDREMIDSYINNSIKLLSKYDTPVKPIYTTTVNGNPKVLCGSCRSRISQSWFHCACCGSLIGWYHVLVDHGLPVTERGKQE